VTSITSVKSALIQLLIFIRCSTFRTRITITLEYLLSIVGTFLRIKSWK